VVVTDRDHELPYSKGLMASEIMATGLAPARAFHVAEVIEQRLHESGRHTITRDELHALALDVIADEVGAKYAEPFSKWRRVSNLDMPLVILVGGATGVGKSTIATMLASRLGITRVIPTDAIREVMRSMLTADLFPTLHTSLFDVGRLVRLPLPHSVDADIIGFREQTAAVTVGIEALVQRAIDEGTDLIVEGAHVVPGFLTLDRFAGKAVAVQLVVTVDEEEIHRSHFLRRSRETRNRPPDRYLDNFDKIRKLQRYVRSLALQHGVPTIPSYSLDATLSQVIDLVAGQAFEAVPTEGQGQGPPATAPPTAPADIQPPSTSQPTNRQARAGSVATTTEAPGNGSGGEL
jgi:2-phosphoglycerate kinase